MSDNRIIQTVVVNRMNSVLKGYKWSKCEVPGLIGVPLIVRKFQKQQEKPEDDELSIFLMIDSKTCLANDTWERQECIVQYCCHF
jgi:hypothetical protein